MQEKISASIKEAMLAKDQVRLDVLRGIKAGITNELVATGKKPQETLDGEGVLKVITKLVKQHRDSIEQFQAGGREDLVAVETAELKILEEFLPEQMSREGVLAIATVKKAELGIVDKTGVGKFVGVLMKELKGKADGAIVKEVVESLF